jgi:hypothetical protein
MQPLYFRAYAYGEETTPMFETYYWLYGTNCYDYCTPYETLAKELQTKSLTPKEIRKVMKDYHQPIKKIHKTYSRYVCSTAEEAIQRLIQRKHRRAQYLQIDLTNVKQFLAYTRTVDTKQILAASNKTYSTNYK